MFSKIIDQYYANLYPKTQPPFHFTLYEDPSQPSIPLKVLPARDGDDKPGDLLEDLCRWKLSPLEHPGWRAKWNSPPSDLSDMILRCINLNSLSVIFNRIKLVELSLATFHGTFVVSVFLCGDNLQPSIDI